MVEAFHMICNTYAEPHVQAQRLRQLLLYCIRIMSF
jgi:hypothetical protein